jgi:nitrite reductase/ring-hydroxylating ferredoxin subunit
MTVSPVLGEVTDVWRSRGDSEEQPMAESLKVAKADELSPGQARRVKVHGKRLALFNIDGNFYAFEDTCAHKGGPLSEGAIAGAR